MGGDLPRRARRGGAPRFVDLGAARPGTTAQPGAPLQRDADREGAGSTATAPREQVRRRRGRRRRPAPTPIDLRAARPAAAPTRCAPSWTDPAFDPRTPAASTTSASSRTPSCRWNDVRLQRGRRRLRRTRRRCRRGSRRAATPPCRRRSGARVDVADLVHATWRMTRSRPAPIRLDDLAVPTLSAARRRGARSHGGDGRDWRRSTPTRSSTPRAASTGLDDFGDDAFVPRLRLPRPGARDRGHASSDVGRVMAHAPAPPDLEEPPQGRGARSRVIPRSRERAIRAPIVIVGLPRTGTTHLHNLMAADPALRSLPYWESLEPVLLDDRAAGAGRARSAARALQTRRSGSSTRALPHFVRMHEMTTDHVHEEIQLLALDVSTMLFETMGAAAVVARPLPSQRTRRRRTAYLRRVLQAMQWQRGGGRWVLEVAAAPRAGRTAARRVPRTRSSSFTHRDPASVMASCVTMAAYTRAHDAASRRSTCTRSAATGATASRTCFRACVRDRHLVAARRGRSTSASTTSCATTSRWCAGSTRSRGRARDGRRRGRVAPRSWRRHPRGVHGTVEYDLAQFRLSTRPRSTPPAASTPSSASASCEGR